MIRKIILENYMAHIHTEIELAEGLTALIGPNNCGKSAIIHALEMICYNSDAADYAIRHGAKKAVVTVETEDEGGIRHKIVWWRKKGTAGYEIDGRTISGLGRGGVPDDLHEHLRMPLIASGAGGAPFRLHFGLQKSPIFLVDDPPSRPAQFFASATDADYLVQMQKEHQLKVTNANRDRKKLEQHLESLDRQLASLSPLEELSQRLAAIQEEYQRLVDTAARIGVLSSSADELDRAGRVERDGLMRVRALCPLANPPDLHETGGISQQIRATEALLSDLSLNGHCHSVLRELQVPPLVQSTAELSSLCTDIAAVSRQHAREDARSHVLLPLVTPTLPQDTSALTGMVGSLERSELQVAQLEMRGSALSDLRGAPLMVATADLAAALRTFDRHLHELTRLQSERGVVESLATAPILGDTQELKAQVDQLERAAMTCKGQESHFEALSTLPSPPALVDSSELESLINQMETGKAEWVRERRMVQQLVDLENGFRLELEQWLRENPRCSACGQEVTQELILVGGHFHER